MDGQGRTEVSFMFTVLPFGLATASYVFTNLLRPLVKRWRSYGFRAIVYIDDGICVASSSIEREKAKKVMLEDLASAGFVINYTKSQLVPQQTGRWPGFLLDLKEGLLQVPADKIEKLQEVIALEGAVSARLLASIVGQIISIGMAIGSITRLLTRYMYKLINSRISWRDEFHLSENAEEELLFWKGSISHYNGQPIWFDVGTYHQGGLL